MANTKVTYSADGLTSDFTFSFPYLNIAHVEVYKNGVLMSTPTNYNFVGSSTVRFVANPVANDEIVIKRNTDIDNRLVDYQSGAVLTEAELDLDSKQAFYLAQEVKENYSDYFEAAILRLATALGVVETTPAAVEAALVQELLSNTLASELAARIADIDTNASSILSLSTTVGDWGADITANATIIAGVEARYGVSINVNGYITGFEQFNDATSGTFQILADKFYIVDPASGGQNPMIPFAVVGGEVFMENVTIAPAGQGATGQRVEISSNNNELEFYGDRGDASVTLQATIGIKAEGVDNVVGYFGNATDTGQGNIAVFGGSYTNIGIMGVSNSNHGIYGVAKSASKAGVNGVNTVTSGSAYGVWGEAYSTTGATGVYGTAGASTGGYGVHGKVFAGNTVGYGVYCEHAQSTGIPLFIKPDSATSTPKASGNSEGSIWVPADGNSILGFFGNGWRDLGRRAPASGSVGTGTSLAFTDVPAGCNRITIGLYFVSSNGTDYLRVQLGDSGGYETTGYNSAVNGGTNRSDSFGITNAVTASTWVSGRIVLERVNGNKWTYTALTHNANVTNWYGAGYKETTGEVDRFRIHYGLTDVFDNGHYVVTYEV